MRFVGFGVMFLSFFSLLAQNSGVEGKILEKASGEAVPYASVSILDLNGELVTGAISQPDGSFRIPVKPGTYNLNIQFIGYEALNQPNITVEKGKFTNLKNLQLSESQQQLEEVVIEAERTQMELKLDKKVFNVGKDMSNLGGTASDVLDNLPSVTVDAEGNVELRGSSNVQVLIDGKPSGIIGLGGTDALRQLQGDIIESVEIITNPSARYDAEGMSGIINIILKKDRKKGINGSFQVNTGWPHNHGASFNLNLRRDWVNLFVNYGINYRNAPGGGEGLQEFTFPDTSYTTVIDRYRERGGISNNVRFGADFFLNQYTTITTSFLYRYSDELNDSELTFTDFSGGDLLNYTLRNDLETEGDENLEYSINFTRTFDNEDKKLTADIQFQDNNEFERSDINQLEGPNSTELNPSLIQKVNNQEGERRWLLQADYIQPVWLNSKFETGYRSTLRNIKNNYLVEEERDGDFVELDTFSTDFNYNENVHALYGIFSTEYDKFSWQVGLRAEYTNINGELKEQSRELKFEYLNFFPSAFLTYKISEENQLQLSYSRRINRPRFRQLNPFSNFTDNRNFRVGNPELQPEFTDSYEFGFLQGVNKSTIYYGVYYRYTTDLINRVALEPNEQGQRVSIPENIGTERALGIEVNAVQEFTDWYSISGNFNFFRNETRGMIGDSVDLSAKTISFTTRITNRFSFKKLFDGQININYRAPQVRPQGKRLSITSVDLGVSRNVLNNKATVSLSGRDLFNTRKWRNITELDNLYEESTWQWRRGPQIVVTFTYRLNQKLRKGGRDGNGRGGYDDGDGF